MVLKKLWKFPRMLLVILIVKIISCITYTQVSKLGKAFANNSSANIKLSKTQLHKIGQSGWFLGSLLGTLIKYGSSLIENVLEFWAKGVSKPLVLTVAVTAATDASIHKKMSGLAQLH